MKIRIAIVAIIAFVAGLVLPKQQMLIWAASALGRDAHFVETFVGPPAFVVCRSDAEYHLSLMSKQEQELLIGRDGFSYPDLWKLLSKNTKLQRAIGYPSGDSIQWILVDDRGRVSASYWMPFPQDARC